METYSLLFEFYCESTCLQSLFFVFLEALITLTEERLASSFDLLIDLFLDFVLTLCFVILFLRRAIVSS